MLGGYRSRATSTFNSTTLTQLTNGSEIRTFTAILKTLTDMESQLKQRGKKKS